MVTHHLSPITHHSITHFLSPNNDEISHSACLAPNTYLCFQPRKLKYWDPHTDPISEDFSLSLSLSLSLPDSYIFLYLSSLFFPSSFSEIAAELGGQARWCKRWICQFHEMGWSQVSGLSEWDNWILVMVKRLWGRDEVGFGEATTTRERVAATKDEGLGYGVRVWWAERVRSVSHVLVEEVSMVVVRWGDWGEAGVEEEIWWGSWFGGCGCGSSGGLEARELVDGDAYGVELLNKVARD